MSDKRAGARLVDRRASRRVPSREGQAQEAQQATFSNELEQLLRCKRSEQPQQKALRTGGLGVGMPLLHRARTTARPDDSIIAVQIQFIAPVGADVIEQTGDLPRNLWASNDQPQLAVGSS